MKTRLLSKSLFAAATFAALLATSSSVLAQVKIGTNPTTIGATNNLEVEGSTSGRKTSVDKVTGQVTIQDGTQGTGKVFTSDANGGGSWQSKDVFCASFDANRAGSQTVPINDAGTGTYTTLISDTEVYDPTNSYNTATGEYTIPATGFYTFKGSSGDNIAGVAAAARNTTIGIFSAAKGNLAFSVVQAQPYLNGSFNNISSLNYLTAGDVITFRVYVVHVSGTKPAATIPVSAIQFSGSRIDCTKN